jgi:folate-binding protein YgfZ
MASAQRGLISQKLVHAGAHSATPAALELARILAGWPRLASEVDEKTIPQEVRFDEIGGVSYTKGCYTGQETVSRLHFRGHANRQLRGLLFESDPPAAPASGWSAITHEERDVGRVTSIAWLPDGGGSLFGGGRWIGLGVVRREVPIGATVRAAGREARVVDLPFDAPHVSPA